VKEGRIPLRRADSAERPIFSGERYVPGLGGTRLAYEHLHRYAFARQFVSGRHVLDLGCGLGYGAELLAPSAREVVSLDRDHETIRQARDIRTHALGPFVVADGGRLPFASQSFGAVVAFELIEHVDEQAALIAEVRRVLRPSGVLLLSSPNTAVYSDKLGERNPFHTREMTTDELRALVAPHFECVLVYRQRVVPSSLLVPDTSNAAQAAELLVTRLDFDPPALVMHPAESDFVYNVVVCGPAKELDPAPGASVLANVGAVQPGEFQADADAEPGHTRAEYQQVWEALSTTEEMAKVNVLGVSDESEFGRTAELTKRMLLDTVGVRTDDTVLEIGAGVGRVGEVLAPLCREWIGTDVSRHMLQHMQQRLGHRPNIRTVLLSGYDLEPIPSDSVDLVYCTVVFMHLAEWERFRYIREGLRVLRPGGRMLVDNFNLLSDEGWDLFVRMTGYHPTQRPPQISATSTPQEIETYFRRAGFTDVRQQSISMWIVTYGRKPLPPPAAQASGTDNTHTD
jgi:ubiquinone/menaquinone biosynthesis C-methylase UbiE